MRFGILFLALAAHSQTPSDVRQLGFMAGCWENQQAGTLEYWTKPGGGSLLGVGRTVKGGKTVFTEYMQIREQEGGLVMSVQLKLADKVTPFRLTKLANEEAVFENPEHDFPQRIIYRKEKDGSLFARVEGTVGGKLKGEDFPMARCR